MDAKRKKLLNEALSLDTSLKQWNGIIYSIVLEEIRANINDSLADLSHLEGCIKIASDVLSENIVAYKHSQKGTSRQKWLRLLSDYWAGDKFHIVIGWCIYFLSPIIILLYRIFYSKDSNYVKAYANKIERIIDSLVESHTLYYQDFSENKDNKDYDAREIDLMEFLQNNYHNDVENQFLARFLKNCNYEFREYNDIDSERFTIIPQNIPEPKTTVPAIVRKFDNSTLRMGIYVTPIDNCL